MNILEITPRVWHMEESYRVYTTLILGETGAILFDTGLGEHNLRPFVEKMVKTGYRVVCSHGHYDHVGGNYRFSEVYASTEDWDLIRRSEKNSSYPLLPLEPGQVFDLGGLHAQVLPLRGHTQGSMGLLLPEEGLLLAGDALSPRLRLMGAEAASLEELKETLHGLEEVPFTRYLASHYPSPLPKKQIQVHLHHLEGPGTLKPALCKTDGGEFFRSAWREDGLRSVVLFREKPNM